MLSSQTPLRARTAWDYAGMLTGVLAMMLVSYVLGHRRIFWEDEMLGWMVARDPSWAHMIYAWKHGADGGGFSFYLTCRAWLSLLGQSPVSFRMYSAVCFGLAFAVNWVTLRRFYASWIVAFALFNTYFASPPVVLHLAEGRFYGLLMLSVSLAMWLAVRIPELPGRIAPQYYVLAFLVHGLLTTSHLLGVVYSFFLLLALVAIDRAAGHFRPGIYAASALSWLLLLPEMSAIRASAQVGVPWFWTTPPTFMRFLGAYTAFSNEIAVVFLLLGIVLLATFRADTARWRAGFRTAWATRTPVYLLAGALLLVPLAFLLEGLVGTSLYINRYLIPVAIAMALLTAEALALIRFALAARAKANTSPARRQALLAGGGVLLAVVLAYWDFRHLPGYVMAQFDYTDRLTAILPKGIPVLFEEAWSFTEVIGRQHASGVRYMYPLDWQQSTDPRAPKLEVTQYNLMKNWQTVGYFSGSVVDLPTFLHENARFLVVNSEGVNGPVEPRFIGNPLILRCSKTPGYQVRRVAVLDWSNKSVWEITHDPATTGMPVLLGAADLR